MAISDRVRKILWGRSGNRCAICRHELVVAATLVDDESVVGDECHIVSGKTEGPRHEPTLPTDGFDEPDNLILLCRVHHKMVDDQHENYTIEVLQKLKMDHERWVATTLTEEKQLPTVRVRPIKGNVPTHLVRLTSGREIMTVVGGAFAFSFEHDEPRSDMEVETLGSFLQEAQDYGDMSSDLEAGERVSTGFRMSTLLRELEQVGFVVFGGREIRRLEGGVGSPSPFPVAILRVVRATSPEIIKVDRVGSTEHEKGE